MSYISLVTKEFQQWHSVYYKWCVFPLQVEHLLADNDGLATSSALLNATTDMERKLSATAAQQFIKLLLKEKWLEQVVCATFIVFLYYLIA